MTSSLFSLRLTQGIIGAGYVLADAELLVLRDHLHKGGLLATSHSAARPLRSFLRKTLTPKGITAVIALHLVMNAGLTLQCFYGNPSAMIMWLSIVALLLLRVRGGLGNNGSDDMLFLIQVAALFGLSTHDWAAGMLFIAAQLSLSYATSAAVKVRSYAWRSGSAIEAIFHSRAFGHTRLAGLFGKKDVARTASWFVIVLEAVCSLGPWIHPRYAVIVLAMAACLHIFIAFGMGLNTFVPAFLATYPSALYVSTHLYRH